MRLRRISHLWSAADCQGHDRLFPGAQVSANTGTVGAETKPRGHAPVLGLPTAAPDAGLTVVKGGSLGPESAGAMPGAPGRWLSAARSRFCGPVRLQHEPASFRWSPEQRLPPFHPRGPRLPDRVPGKPGERASWHSGLSRDVEQMKGRRESAPGCRAVTRPQARACLLPHRPVPRGWDPGCSRGGKSQGFWF